MPCRPVVQSTLPFDPSLTRQILLGDNLAVLPTLPRGLARLAYIDPPFNTGKRQAHSTVKAVQDDDGNTGFGGRRYRLAATREKHVYEDAFDDYLGFLMPRIEAALPCLTPDGSLFVHLDCREAHYVKVALDQLLGRDSFMNEIIWAYDYGGRSKSRWSAKHDTILWYALDPTHYVFDFEAMDRIPYMAPGLVGPEKAARGKTPTDVWCTPSSRREARSARATPRRSRWACSSASSRCTASRATWCSTSLRAAGPPATRPRGTDAATC